MDGKTQFEYGPVRQYITMLVLLVLLLCGAGFVIWQWQESRYASLEDRSHNYHQGAVNFLLQVEDELHFVETQLLERLISRPLSSGLREQSSSDAVPIQKTLEIPLTLIAQHIQSIRETQDRFQDPTYARTLDRLESQLAALRTTTEQNQDETSEAVATLQSKTAPFLLTLEQLTRLHDAAYRETEGQLEAHRADSALNLLLLVSILIMAGAIAARKIYRLINLAIARQLETAEKLHLTQVALDHSPVAAYWMNPEGRFVYVNEASVRMSGYPREALLSLSTFDLNLSMTPAQWEEAWHRLEKEHSFTLETYHHRKDGTTYPVEVTANYVEFEGKQYNCSQVRDITKRRQIQEMLHQTNEHLEKRVLERTGELAQTNVQLQTEVLERTQMELALRELAEVSSESKGQEFFCHLVSRLAKTLDTEFAFVGLWETANPHRVTTLVVCENGEAGENFEYDLQGAPCENVLGKTLCAYPDNVCQLFPKDDMLQQMGAESYIGSPLFNTAGEPIGLIAALGRQPLKVTDRTEALVRLYAQRASTEIERQRAEDEILSLNADLEQKVEERTAELSQSQALLEQAQTLARMGSWELDIDTDQRRISPEVYRLFDLEPLSAPPRDYFFKTIHPEDRGRVEEAFQKTLQTGKPYDIEYRRVRPEGSIQYLHSHGTITESRNGKPVKLLGTIQDITERKRAEEALQQSEARFRSVFEYAPLGISLIDKNGNIIDCNSTYADILGYDRNELLKMTIADFTHPGDIQKDLDFYDELKTGTRDSYQMEKRYIRKDGETVWINLRASLLYDSEGQVTASVGMVHDITARKQTEKALQHSEAKFRSVFEYGPIGVVLGGSDGYPAETNATFREILGYEKEEIRKLHFTDFTHPDDVQKDVELFNQLLAGKRDFYEMEKRYIRKDGETVWVNLRMSMVFDAAGKQMFPVGMVHDITDRKLAEGALRKSEFALARAQQVAHVGNWEFDIVTGTVIWSEENYRIYGVDRETFVPSYEAFLDLHHPEDRDRVDQINRNAMQTGVLSAFEHRILHPDGAIRHLHSRGEMTKDASGKVVYMFGTVQDITKRKKAEEAVSRSEKQFRALIESAPDGLLLADKEGHILLSNPRAQEMFGYGREELIGQKVEALIPERLRGGHIAKRDGFVAHPSPRPMAADQDLYALRKDGSEFPIELSLGPIESGDGLLVAATISDITDRKKAEEALLTSEALLQEAQRVSSMGSWEWNITTGDLKWSDEIYRLFGQTPQSFDATYDAFLGYIHPEDRQMVNDAVEAAVNNREPYSLDHRILRPDGAPRYIHEQGEVTYDSDGTPLRMVGTVHDVTDRKLAEDALVEKAEELARSNADLEQFAYVASHDLQEPLRMVTSFTQLLQRRYEGQLDKKADQYIGFAVDGTKRMQSLIKDLLTYSRASRQDSHFEPTECEGILQHSIANLSLAIQENQADITHDPLPAVLGDDVLLGQLFQNLIGNALKFRGEEAPRVHLSARRDGKQWIFSVRDNGLGIEPEFRERIFVIFQRLHHREDYAGTGIGLALCKKIVERHGGRIWVESEPGQGSTFYFTIPMEGVRHDERIRQPVG